MANHSSHTDKNSAVSELILAGRISGIFGIKGWLKVVSWCDPKDNILTYQPWWLADGTQPSSQSQQQMVEKQMVEIEQSAKARSGRSLVVKLKNLDLVEQIRPLIDKQIWVDLAAYPRRKNEFYWFELIGMQVINQSNQSLGKVVSLLETGHNDVLDIQQPVSPHSATPQKPRRYLIPYVWQRYISSIDRNKRLITVDWSTHWQS